MTDWRLRAECRHHDPEIWFPGTGRGDKTRQAKAICARCPVIDDCRAYAERQRPQYGIWAGEARTVRANGYRSEGQLKPCGTEAAYRQHLRKGERPCAACVHAAREIQKQRWRSRG